MNLTRKNLGLGTLPGLPGIVARHKWLVLACALACACAAYVYSATRVPVYTAATQLKYQQQVDVSDPLSTDSWNFNAQQVAMELESVDSEINSPKVVQGAAATLGLSPDDSQLEASGEVVPNTAMVEISTSNTQAKKAATIANAIADAFVEVRKETERERLAAAEAVVQQKLKGYQDADSRMSSDYILLSQRLSDLQIAQAMVTGDYRVIAPASTPTAPSWPHPMRDAVLGLAFGLFAGICIAVVLEQVNVKTRSHREIAQLLQLPVLGRIPAIPKRVLAEGPMVVLREPNGPTAESLRLLRRNIETLTLDQPLMTLMVASPVAGEGKSLTVANLAVTLALGGKNVAVVDCDIRRPTLHQYFAFDNTVGLSTVLSGGVDLKAALRPFPLPMVRVATTGRPVRTRADAKTITEGSLVVLTAGDPVPSPGELLASGHFSRTLRSIEESVDLVLVDTPAFLAVSDAATIAAVTDGVLLLVDVSSATKPMLAEAREFIDHLPCRKLGVVTVRDRLQREAYGYSSADGRTRDTGSAGVRPSARVFAGD